MRHKPLRRVMFAGTLLVAGGALLHQLLLGPSAALTRWTSATGAMLASIRQWIQLTLVHTSPAQIVEGVGVAWFIFVLVLLLLSCTDRAEPLHRKFLVHVSLDTAPKCLPPPHRPLLELPYAADDNAPSDSAEVSQVNGNALDLSNGYLLASTRIAVTEWRCVPHSFFVVAECVGRPTSNSDGASRQTVDVIACLVVPLLGRDTVVAVAGIMVVGNDVYVVNFRHWGAYPFRPLG